jgi:hypothetical protein
VRLSHRDFRPAKRSKYVAAPPRKRPTLRILLLIAFGILVYLKFDSFVKSKALQSFRGPEKIWQSLRERFAPMRPPPAALQATFDSASSRTRLDCVSPRFDECLAEWKTTEEDRGRARSLIRRASHAAGITRPDGFSLSVKAAGAEDEDSSFARLESLELRGDGRAWIIEPSKDGLGYCFRGGPCLEAPRVLPPLAKLEAVDHGDAPGLWLKASEGWPVLAMLPGRIMEVTGDSLERELEVYHGGTLYCRYGGLSPSQAGPKAGDWVSAGDTLGLIAAPSERLTLILERDGFPADAAAFLGLPPR